MSTAIVEYANEPGIFPGSPPESLPNEELALVVQDGFKKLVAIMPYVKELRQRFKKMRRGHAGIMGCNTWTEFCEKRLGRSDSAIRKALAAEKTNTTPPREKKLLEAVKALWPATDCEQHQIRFSRENDLLTLSTPDGRARVELDVPLPNDTKGIATLEAGGIVVPIEVEFETLWDFTLNGCYLVGFLKECDGDPSICPCVRNTGDLCVEFNQWDGNLRYIQMPLVDTPKPRRAERYPGEFSGKGGPIVLLDEEGLRLSNEWHAAKLQEAEKREEEERQREAQAAARREYLTSLLKRLPPNMIIPQSVEDNGTGVTIGLWLTDSQLTRLIDCLEEAA